MLYLDDIADCCRLVIEYSSGMDLASFLNQHMARDAILHNLQTIGEAANRLPPEFRDRYSHVDWRGIIALRHVIVHGYAELNYDIVWSVVQDHAPQLLAAVERILAIEPPEAPA
jgi:uncharacterized protein with HEPN domain